MGSRLTIGLVLLGAWVLSLGLGLLAAGVAAAPPDDDRDRELARVTARLLRRELTGTIRTLELGAGLFDLEALAPQEVTGVLRLLYKQETDLTVVGLLDDEDQTVVDPVYLDAEQLAATGEGQRHLPVDLRDLERFFKRVPLAAARERGRALSDVYIDDRRNAILLAGALGVPGGEQGPPYLLVFERSLRRLQALVAAGVQDPNASSVFVVDGGGRLVAHPDGNQVLERRSMGDHPLVARFLEGAASGRGRFAFGASGPLRGAFQRLDFLDWAVVVQRPAVSATAGGPAGWWWGIWLGGGLVLALAGCWILRRLGRQQARTAELRAASERRSAELQRVQASLLEARKLNAIGDLGAGVAHEFNNPLGGILGLTQLLLRRKKEGDADLQFLQRIEQEAKRCKAITDNLLRFSEQQGSEHREPLRIERVIEKAVDLIDSRLDRERVSIERAFEPEVARVVGNEGELQRAFLNVMLNAETAMPEGGRLKLAVRGVDQWVEVAISDTGRGISAENLERVFEPFFTTKDDWKGAGLGLWVVFQIVQDHGGGVSVDSQPGEGTTVTISLPRQTEDDGEKSAPVPLA